MNKDLILVTGASGTLGSEISRQLRAEGYRVRATTSKAPRDTDTVRVDLATGEGVSQAFEGVDCAFLLSPPGYADQYQILSPLIQEAKRRGLKKVVLLTAMGANLDENSPFRRAEVELEKSGLEYNIVRPNWFLQNFQTFWIQGIKEQGKISLPAGNAKTSFIDAHDISEVVVKLLTTEQFNNRAFDITGPEALDHHQIAQAISDVTGKRVTYEDIKPEVLKQGLVGAGLPVAYVDFLLLIFGYLREGYNARTTDQVKQILGRAPRSLMLYAAEAKAAWL